MDKDLENLCLITLAHGLHTRSVVLAALLEEEEEEAARPKKRKRTVWVKPWISERPLHGHYHHLMKKLEQEDWQAFKNFVRFYPDKFHYMANRLDARLRKQVTNFRVPLEPELKLAIALRHFASGDGYVSLQYNFLVSNSAISNLMKEVSQAIIDEFRAEFVKSPRTKEEWLRIAESFKLLWNFHHTLGALDGKHIRVKKPPQSGSSYHNYKKYFSLLMLALVDAEYKFLWYDIGTPGSCSDAQIWNGSELKALIEAGQLDFPEKEPLPGCEQDVPYFLISDDAFALKTHLMKPYPGRNLDWPERIFNYRLSRARRVVENAFGILAMKFQCLLGERRQNPETVNLITEACIVLHNMSRTWYPNLKPREVDTDEQNGQLLPGEWREKVQLEPLRVAGRGGARPTQEAKAQRDYLRDFYNGPIGAVSWQDQWVRTGYTF